MSRSNKLILELLSAAAFYGFFGFAVPLYLAPEAAASIEPAIQIVVTVLTVLLVAISLSRFFQSDKQ